MRCSFSITVLHLQVRVLIFRIRGIIPAKICKSRGICITSVCGSLTAEPDFLNLIVIIICKVLRDALDILVFNRLFSGNNGNCRTHQISGPVILPVPVLTICKGDIPLFADSLLPLVCQLLILFLCILCLISDVIQITDQCIFIERILFHAFSKINVRICLAAG